MITKVFHEHGIPLGASVNNVALATEMPLAPAVSGGTWEILEGSSVSSTRRPLGTPGTFGARGRSSSLPGKESRLLWFTEEKKSWKLPLGELQTIQRMAVDKEKGNLHILTTSPSVLYSVNLEENRLTETPFDRFIDSAHVTHRSRFQMAVLGGKVAVFDPEV